MSELNVEYSYLHTNALALAALAARSASDIRNSQCVDDEVSGTKLKSDRRLFHYTWLIVISKFQVHK